MISVVVPTKNRAELLVTTLGSVRYQTFADWECLVVDDHSTDDTAQVVAAFTASDARISYLHLEEGATGANAARNLGARAAKGDLLIFLDSDDALAPHCLGQRAAAMADRPDLDFAVWPTLLFDAVPGDSSLLWNIQTGEDNLDRYLYLDIPWQTAGVIWRRSALRTVGGWKEGLPSWQDWEFYVRALTLDLKYREFPGPDSYWRKPRPDSLWSQSRSGLHLTAQTLLIDETWRRLKKKGCLTSKRKHLLAGLYFWVARVWYSSCGDRWQAAMVWNRAHRRNLISCGRYVKGCRWFSRFTRGKSRNLSVVFPTWPQEYLIEASPTFQKIPYEDSASTTPVRQPQ